MKTYQSPEILLEAVNIADLLTDSVNNGISYGGAAPESDVSWGKFYPV